MAEKYKKDGLVVLAVNSWDEPKEILEQYVQQAKLAQRVLLSGGEVSDRFGIPNRSVPTVFWIDRAGVVKDVDMDEMNLPALERKADKLLAAKG